MAASADFFEQYSLACNDDPLRCFLCNRRLTDAESRTAGMGPICRGRFNIIAAPLDEQSNFWLKVHIPIAFGEKDAAVVMQRYPKDLFQSITFVKNLANVVANYLIRRNLKITRVVELVRILFTIKYTKLAFYFMKRMLDYEQSNAGYVVHPYRRRVIPYYKKLGGRWNKQEGRWEFDPSQLAWVPLLYLASRGNDLDDFAEFIGLTVV